VQKVVGLAATSASPTDIWRIEFKPYTTYYGEELVSAYLKISVNPTYLDTFSNRGLEYEREVYTQVTNELLDRRICPHFVRGLLTGSMCSFEDLHRILRAGVDPQTIPADAPADYLQVLLIENIAFMTVKPIAASRKKSSAAAAEAAANPEANRRPAITNFGVRPDPPSFVRDPDATENIEQTLRYGCLVTERLDVISLSDWLAKDTKFRYEDFLGVVFQLIVVLWVMELRKMVHYDLHTGNVLIENVRPRRLGYVLNGVEYKVNTTYFVRVFDYDRSYVVSMGCNRWHTETECQFVPNLDLARLLCDMFTDLKLSTHQHATRFIRTLEDVFGVMQGSITPNVCSVVKAGAVEKKVPNASGVPQDLLRDCLPRLHKRMEQPVGQAELYVIDQQMFRPNGELRSEEEYGLMLERKQVDNPTNNEEWAQFSNQLYQIQTSIKQVGREVDKVNSEVIKTRERDSVLTAVGTTASMVAATGAIWNWWKNKN
jgi:hypothetical protein